MVVFRPPLLVVRCAAGWQDTVDVAFEAFHLPVDLVALGQPCDVYLAVGHIQRLDLRPTDQRRVDGLRLVYLVVEVDTRQRAVRQLVLARRRFPVLVVQRPIVQFGREGARAGLHDRDLSLFRRIVVIGNRLCMNRTRRYERYHRE